MRVLHAISQYPSMTGSGIYCRSLMRAWKDSGFAEQTLLYGRNASQTEPNLGVPSYPVIFESEELPFPLPGMSDKMPYRSTVYGDMTPEQIERWKAAFRVTLSRAIAETQPDLIVCNHIWWLASLCVETGVPVVAFCHGTDLRQAARHPELVGEAPNLSGLRGVIALTKGHIPDIQALTGLSEQQIYVAGGAYDPARFRPEGSNPGSLAGHSIHFLYAGKISDSKGVFELLSAFHACEEEDILLDVVGNRTPEDVKRCEDLIEGDKRIRFQPAVPQAVLADEMRAHDVFILPSYYEGLALIAVEALASGCRLIMTDLPSLHEFLGEEIWQDSSLTIVPMPRLMDVDKIVPYARPAHVARLSAAISEQAGRVRQAREACAKASPEQRTRRGRAASNLDHTLADCVKKFSWDALGERVMRFVEGCLRA